MRLFPWIGALVMVLLVGVLAASCGESVAPEATPTAPGSAETPTPTQHPGSGEDPTTSQTGPTPTVVLTLGIPDWLTSMIQRLENEPVAGPPASIIQYGYKGQTVYFLPQRCCDFFSVLYDANGNIIGHPDGGITGQGDGRVPDFFDDRTGGRVIWEDERVYERGLVQSPASIENIEIIILESFSPRYRLRVVSGLPNACMAYGGYTLSREGNVTRVDMVNWKPADPEIMCNQVYSTVVTTIPLGPGFKSGATYTVEVNDVTETFVAQ